MFFQLHGMKLRISLNCYWSPERLPRGYSPQPTTASIMISTNWVGRLRRLISTSVQSGFTSWKNSEYAFPISPPLLISVV